jgi:hypothetical protein
MPCDRRPSITAGQQRVPGSGTPQASQESSYITADVIAVTGGSPIV